MNSTAEKPVSDQGWDGLKMKKLAYHNKEPKILPLGNKVSILEKNS